MGGWGQALVRVDRRARRAAVRLATRAERRRIARSGLFDANFYSIENPDAGRDPLFHFCAEGSDGGRRPNLYFDPAGYGAAYLDAGANPGRPLLHYIRVGEAAGLRPTPSFDPAWYARRYALPARTSPLAHYLANRRTQRFAPNPHFDLDFYLARHGEEIGPNRDPYAHFLRFGAARDLDPSPAFDSRAYRAAFMTGQEAAEADPSVSAWTVRESRIPLVHALSVEAKAAAGRARTTAVTQVSIAGDIPGAPALPAQTRPSPGSGMDASSPRLAQK